VNNTHAQVHVEGVRKSPKASKLTQDRLDKITNLFIYSSTEGSVRCKKNNAKLVPHPDRKAVRLWLPDEKIQLSIFLKNLSWMLWNKKLVPEGKTVLCKDLNEDNLKISNLILVDSSDYKKIVIALKNLRGACSFRQHPSDKHAYIVYWIEPPHITREEVHYDIGMVQSRMKELKIIFSKFISKYTVTL
jgi:hypothetical protein